PRLFPDADRLALPRPPNLDSQYRTSGCWCQEKIAKSGEEISMASISSGGLSGTAESRDGAGTRLRDGSTLKSGLLLHSSCARARVIWQEAGIHRRDGTRASRTLSSSGNTR